MPKVCGQAVHGLWAHLAQTRALSPRHITHKMACVKVARLSPALSNFCTQLSHTTEALFAPVTARLYPLCTAPITTTTIDI